MKYLEEMSIPNHNYFNFKLPFKGSYKQMRFYVEKKKAEEEGGADTYLAVTYPDKVSFEETPEEEKIKESFSFDLEGRKQVLEWLDAQYDAVYKDM